jgi:hypothetical protein
MRQAWRGIVFLLGCFAGLCTLFAGCATAYDAWREQVHAGWPTAQARVSRCEIRDYRSRGASYYIRCRFAYAAAGQAVEAQINSGSVPDPSRVIWRSPGYPGLEDLQAWVDAHPAGTSIDLHYDPANPNAAALVATDMPLAGPKAPGDLKLLGAFGLSSLVLLLIGGVRRKRQ